MREIFPWSRKGLLGCSLKPWSLRPSLVSQDFSLQISICSQVHPHPVFCSYSGRMLVEMVFCLPLVGSTAEDEKAGKGGAGSINILLRSIALCVHKPQVLEVVIPSLLSNTGNQGDTYSRVQVLDLTTASPVSSALETGKGFLMALVSSACPSAAVSM